MFAPTSLFYPTIRLSRLSFLRTQDLPSWMWNDLSWAAWFCVYRQIPYSVWCTVLCLPSSGLWCFSQGWQRFLPAYRLYYVATWLLLQAPCFQQLPWCYKFLQSTLLCLSDAIQFMPDALQYSLAKSCVTLLPSAQAHCPLPVMCLLNARLPLADDWLWLSNPAQTYCNKTLMYTDYLQWSYCCCALHPYKTQAMACLVLTWAMGWFYMKCLRPFCCGC